MFGIGTPELIVILVVALIFLGPKRLPEVGRALGKALGELRRASQDLRDSIEVESRRATELDRPQRAAPPSAVARATEAQLSSLTPAAPPREEPVPSPEGAKDPTPRGESDPQASGDPKAAG
jgi:Tat protein translocase TatB subunit